MAKVGGLGIALAVPLIIILLASSTSLASTRADFGDVARGRAVFEQSSFHGAPGCITCHSLAPGVTVIGPSLAGVGTRAVTLLHSPNYKGLATTPEELFREAILTRDCNLWGSGNRHAIIPEWEGVLDRQELDDLSAFLSSLKQS